MPHLPTPLWAHLARDGLRVVELSTMITASFVAMILGEHGTNVTKVEPPGMGDPRCLIIAIARNGPSCWT